MIFFLISCLYFLLLSKFLSLQPLPLTEERSLCVWFWRELTGLFLQWLKDYGLSNFIFRMSLKKKSVPKVENVGEVELSLLDLPELTLECILGRLSPAGLSNMAEVCSSLRDRCRSDHLWERHMKEKWGRLIGQSAYKEWQWFIASRNNSGATDGAKLTSWLGTILCIWPVSWFRSLIDGGGKLKSPLPVESIMCLYLSLEGGKFWFPAQVYNREHGHVGFMLSCYDAELSYDCYTDTFHARYPPHGRRTIVIEEGVQWERLRAPPVDTPPHDLHVSDCLNDLRPGDHIEIQWRRSNEFPYGWWYGVVGHLESCDRNERYCRCHNSDTVILEFNQYTPDSRWRRTTINRKDHREEGIEEDGFYGGIRKLYCKEEIAKWEGLRPTDGLE